MLYQYITDSQTEKQRDRMIYEQTYRHREMQAHEWTEGQTDIQTDEHMAALAD